MDNSSSNPTSTPTPPFQRRSTTKETHPLLSESLAKTNKKKLIWGLICLLGPTLLLVITIFTYAVVNFLIADTAQSSSELFTTSPVGAVFNTLMFLVGALVILTWLPGIIAGIVLLATRRKLPPRQQ